MQVLSFEFVCTIFQPVINKEMTIARAGEADKDDASIIAFLFSSTCGIAKEINDEAKRNDWSYKT